MAPATETRPETLARWRRSELILLGHGSTALPGANTILARHAENLEARGLFAKVRFGALYGDPAAETALRQPRLGEAYVVPLFMCHGRYTRQVIPGLFGLAAPVDGAGLHFCPPVGLHPRLTQIIVERAVERLRAGGEDPGEASLVIVGHGSTESDGSRQATRGHCLRARRRGLFRSVRMAFLDEAPTLARVLSGLNGPLVVAGLFAAEGAHARRDVPEALAGYRGGAVYHLGPLGSDPALPEVILAQVSACTAA
jgi:sirohydrochlorin cobaltochelatase